MSQLNYHGYVWAENARNWFVTAAAKGQLAEVIKSCRMGTTMATADS